MDNYTIMPLFSSPLYVSELDLDIDEILNHLRNVDYTLLTNGSRSKDNYILNQPELVSLKVSIEENIKVYTRDVLCVKNNTEFYIVNSWMYKLDPNQSAPEHIHSNSVLSGVVYLNEDYQNSGNIIFKKQQNHLSVFTPSISPDLESFNIFNSSEWFVEPNQKMIVLFPSHLLHRVTENNTTESRYSLAFNVFVKGNISDTTGFNDLIL